MAKEEDILVCPAVEDVSENMDDLVSILDSVISEYVPLKTPFSAVQLVNCVHPRVYNGNVCRCGKCLLCRVSERSNWSLRLDLEALTHVDNSFSTLTYDNEHLPYELNKKHFQDFMKRLRKRLDYPIRYFGAGEYGDRFTHRPHFHFVGFGLKQEDYPKIAESWDQGFVKTNMLSSARCNYVCGYVQKKLSFFYQDDRVPDDFYNWSYLERVNYCIDNNIQDVDPRQRPFALMSRMPGLSFAWYDQHKKELINKFFIPMNGKRKPIPRFLRLRLEEDFPGWKLKFADYLESKLFEDFEKFKKKYNTDSVDQFLDYERDLVKHRAEEFKRKNELYFMRKRERDNIKVV